MTTIHDNPPSPTPAPSDTERRDDENVPPTPEQLTSVSLPRSNGDETNNDLMYISNVLICIGCNTRKSQHFNSIAYQKNLLEYLESTTQEKRVSFSARSPSIPSSTPLLLKRASFYTKKKPCCDDYHEEDGHGHGTKNLPTRTYLAIVRGDNSAVDVFYGNGRSRTFRFRKDVDLDDLSRELLCFSTHGSEGIDGLLNSCLDYENKSVVSEDEDDAEDEEEKCPCGVDELLDVPHLHAHVYDSSICDDAAASNGGVDWKFLSQLTFHPDDDRGKIRTPSAKEKEEKEKDDPASSSTSTSTSSSCYLPISDSTPDVCNSTSIEHHLHSRGLKLSHWLRWRRGGKLHSDATSRCDTSKYCGETCQDHRQYPVRHENHTDYLIHNEAMGELHMERPNCEQCEGSDIHGRFRLVHTRSWIAKGGRHNHGCKADDEGEGGGVVSHNCGAQKVNLHFFKVTEEPFHLLDVLAGLFELSSGRSTRVTDMSESSRGYISTSSRRRSTEAFFDASSSSKNGNHIRFELDTSSASMGRRSQFASLDASASSRGSLWSRSTRMLDASASSIGSLSRFELGSNRTQVVDISVSSRGSYRSDSIHNRPSSRNLDASHASGKDERETKGKETNCRIGRSQFFVIGICCAAEIPMIESILLPIKGVENVRINTTSRTVFVEHDVDVAPADNIADALNKQGFATAIEKNAVVAMDAMSGIPTTIFVTSKFDLKHVFEGTAEDADRAEIAGNIRGCIDEKFTDVQVKNVSVDVSARVLSVEHNPYYLTATGLVVYLAGRMQDANIPIASDGGADGMWALENIKQDSEDDIHHHSASMRWTVVLSGVLWVVSMFSLLGGNWDYLKYVALLSVAFGLPPIAVKAFKTLQRYRFDVNCMMLFAAVGALALEEYTESAAVTFLFAISEALETRATARARNALSAIINLRPENARVVNSLTKDVVILPASAVAVGSLVSVRAGDKVPCDGVVFEGKSTIDESSLTGESKPVSKSPGMRVSGGTINAGNTQLIVKTTATSNNSAVARLIRLIEDAQLNRGDTEMLVDSFAKIYTPIVVLAALGMCTIPWVFGTEVGKTWAKNGLITIVIACPCALIISTPVTYVAGLAAAAQKGVIVKGGQYLEGLGRVNRVAFDKTGTISQGVFDLLHFNVVGEKRSRKAVFEYLALMEAPASHPLSDAIVKGAANEQIGIPKLQLKNHTILPGEGITANVGGKIVYVGNKKLFQRLGLHEALPKEVSDTTEDWAKKGGNIGFISIEGDGIVGTYVVADKVREEARDVVQSLQKMGIEISILTGDQRSAAIGMGEQIGLGGGDIKSDLLPEDKLTEIEAMVKENEAKKKVWKAKRAVVMVGDGVNDAPALALADVSVAMGEGAALAMDTADVTLMDSDLNKLLFIVDMGRRVVRTIIENVAFSLILKAVVMGFTFAGKASLWAAIASDVGGMLVVTMNSMKLLPSSRKVKRNESARESV